MIINKGNREGNNLLRIKKIHEGKKLVKYMILSWVNLKTFKTTMIKEVLNKDQEIEQKK